MANIIMSGEHVSRRFGGAVALDDVEFRLQEGEILGLIGPNGAGKTTLINIISGNLKASGEIHFRDHIISGFSSHEIASRGIARTFQLVRPFLGMTVEDNILVGALFGRARDEDRQTRMRRLEQVLAFLGLEGRRAEPVRRLNIPDRKKVELGRALAMEPLVLLLDELLAGLNPTEMETLMKAVREINRRGVALIVVEHVMRAVAGLCHRVMVLHHGRKIADGPVEQVLDDRRVIEAYLGRSYADRMTGKPKATEEQ